MDEIEILMLANKINLNTFKTIYLETFWTNVETENKQIKGNPTFPRQFSKFILKDSISAQITDINVDSLSLTINKGKDNGLFYGCDLTNGKDIYTVKYLYKNSARLLPSRLYLEDEMRKKYNNKDTLDLSLEDFRNEFKKLKKFEILCTKK